MLREDDSTTTHNDMYSIYADVGIGALQGSK